MHPANRPRLPHVPSHVFDPRVVQQLQGHGPRPLPPPPPPIAATSRVGVMRPPPPTPSSTTTSAGNTSSSLSVAKPSTSRKKSTMSQGSKKDEEEEEDDDDEEGEDEEGGTKIITGIKKKRRIVLSRRTYLLSALVVITMLCIGAVVYGSHQLNQHGHPPVQYASEASKNAYYSLIFLLVISPIGFFVLKFRVTNMLIGLAYMFLLVLCIIYPVKAVLNGFLSLHYEDDSRNRLYISDETNEKKLHKFWGYNQNLKCCGTRDIDRVDDWPYLLNTTNIPPSCCTPKWRREFSDFHEQGKSNDSTIMCGLGLGRWRTKALQYNYTHPKRRLFSGFYALLSQHQLKRINEKFKVVADPHNYDVVQMDIVDRKFNKKKNVLSAFDQNWQNLFMDEKCNVEHFVRTHDKTGTIQYQPGDCEDKTIVFHNDMLFNAQWDKAKAKTPSSPRDGDQHRQVGFLSKTEIDSIRAFCTDPQNKFTYGYMMALLEEEKARKAHPPNSPTPFEFDRDEAQKKKCEEAYQTWRRSATSLGRPLLLNLDYLTTYLSDLGKYATATGKPSKKRFDIFPKKSVDLIARWIAWKIRLHESLELSANLHRKATSLKSMYYLSKGIAENFVLRGVVNSIPCGSIKDENFEEKLGRDMNKRWIKAGSLVDWKNPQYGLGDYFVEFVRRIVGIAIIVSSVSIFFVIVIAIVFWQYYSRIKAEDYANLALPKEFEVLHMKRGSLIDAGEMQYEPKEKHELMMSDVHHHHKLDHKDKHRHSIHPSAHSSVAYQ